MSDNINQSGSNRVGAVMVVGGGIAGMQASLDMANSGFKVYLVEELSSIGGRMAQLDKTFPTNDCSMCMISPKLIEVGKHPNIEIITNARVHSIEGKEGNFSIDVLKKARYIDLVKCTGCGSCAQTECLDADVLHTIDGQTFVDRIKINEAACIQCGKCAVACVTENQERQGISAIAMKQRNLIHRLPAERAETEILLHKISRMTKDERIRYWRGQLSKCIKCYGCRDICPICLCQYCEMEEPSWVASGRIPAEFPLFHLIRAYHVGTSCIGCGACEKTCPMGIPLFTLMEVARVNPPELFDYVPGLSAEDKKRLIESVEKAPILERKVRA
jgi:ferredoxin